MGKKFFSGGMFCAKFSFLIEFASGAAALLTGCSSSRRGVYWFESATMCNDPIHPYTEVLDGDVQHVLNGLRTCCLPEGEWTHGAHLCAGTALLKEVGLTEAERQMPGFIQAYNESLGNQNTQTSGYHHTITIFYLRAISDYLGDALISNDESVGKLAIKILESPLADTAYPLSFYSKEVLFSVEARQKWVPPDRC